MSELSLCTKIVGDCKMTFWGDDEEVAYLVPLPKTSKGC